MLFLKENKKKKKKEEGLSTPADVRSLVRKRRPHPADPADPTGTWPRLILWRLVQAPVTGAGLGSKGTGRGEPAGRWRCRPGSGCARAGCSAGATPGARPTRSVWALKLGFNEKCKAGEKKIPSSPTPKSQAFSPKQPKPIVPLKKGNKNMI